MDGAAAAPELLERERELERLTSVVARAERGHGSLAVLEGPAGIGKTALVELVCADARARGMQVAIGRSSELAREVPLGIARRLLDGLLAGAGAARRAVALAAGGEIARRLLDPEDADPAPGDPSFGARGALDRAVASLEGPALLLAVDDAHWADGASLRWLSYLAPSLAERPLAVLVAARPPGPDTDPALAELVAAGVRTRVAPLSAAAVAGLVRNALGPDRADDQLLAASHTATGGNPMLLRELLTELRLRADGGDVIDADQVAAIGPAGLSRAVLARLGRLSHDAIATAAAVAVLADDADPVLVAEITGIPEHRARWAADGLVAAGILDSRLPLAFVHPILRSAVDGDLGPGRRADLHRRAAEALGRRGAAPERIAIHLMACEPRGDAAVVAVLRRAAELARARGAPDAAVRLLHRALAEPVPEAERAWTLAELGAVEAAGAGADAATAIERLTQALDGELPAVARLAVARTLAGVLFAADRGADAAAALARAIDAAGDLPLDTVAPPIADLSVIAMSSPQALAIAGPYGGRLVAALGDLATVAGRHAAAGAAGAAVMFGGSAPAASALARAALAGDRLLADESADALAFYTAPLALLFADDSVEALRALDAAFGDAERRGSGRALAMVCSLRALAHLAHGRLDAAEHDAERALEVCREVGLHLGVPIATAALAEVTLARGTPQQAWAVLSRATERPTESIWGAWLGEIAARIELAAGRPDRAAEHARHAGAVLDGFGVGAWPVIGWRGSLAVALVAGAPGVEGEAPVELVDRQLADARAFAAPRVLGAALLARARVAAAGRGPQGSVRGWCEEAVAVLADRPAVLDRARALVELGVACRRAGEISPARVHLRAGLDGARVCGAVRLAERAHDELEATGLRPRRIVVGGIEALTPSERRVAEMAARGMSNREIAGELFLAERTVETHLAHSYRKLAVNGRRELAGRLR